MKTKKQLRRLFVTIVTLIGLCAITCCGVYTSISVNSEPSADLSKYKTFAWLPDDADTANSPYNNEIIRNNLKNYFGRSFSERGYSVNLDTPDVLLQIIIVNKKREISYPIYPQYYYYCSYYFCSTYYSPYPYNYYYRHSRISCDKNGYCKERVQFVEGSITLNMIDRKQNKLVWSGTAKGDIYDPKFINKDIHPAVLRIMKKFPIKTIEQNKKPGNEVVMINPAVNR